jgi:hypothetical protein
MWNKADETEADSYWAGGNSLKRTSSLLFEIINNSNIV